MPIYEFYCSRCNTIYNFRSRTVNTTARPACPHCADNTLERRISSFSVLRSGRIETEDALDELPFDEQQMERAFESMSGDIEHLDEKNPRALAQLMRKLSQTTGMEYNERMEEMVRRLESGEDPDVIEQDYGDLGEDENPFDFIRKKRGVTTDRKPRHDDTLYDM